MDYLNQVRLVGRVSATGEPRGLPSGDVVHTLRVVVPREARRDRDHAGVDTIDVACWSAGVRRSASRLAVDDHVEVEGALRRRFFRAGGGVASRYEVEARALRRVRGAVAAPG
jgi:single-strand DNA-binding protein